MLRLAQIGNVKHDLTIGLQLVLIHEVATETAPNAPNWMRRPPGKPSVVLALIKQSNTHIAFGFIHSNPFSFTTMSWRAAHVLLSRTALHVCPSTLVLTTGWWRPVIFAWQAHSSFITSLIFVLSHHTTLRHATKKLLLHWDSFMGNLIEFIKESNWVMSLIWVRSLTWVRSLAWVMSLIWVRSLVLILLSLSRNHIEFIHVMSLTWVMSLIWVRSLTWVMSLIWVRSLT